MLAEAEGLRLHLSSAAATGYKGVIEYASGRFQARRKANGFYKGLGTFGTAVEAAVAYARAVEEAAAAATAAAVATAGAVAAGAEPAGAEPTGAEQQTRSSNPPFSVKRPRLWFGCADGRACRSVGGLSEYLVPSPPPHPPRLISPLA